jgi:hypothetical protein
MKEDERNGNGIRKGNSIEKDLTPFHIIYLKLERTILANNLII